MLHLNCVLLIKVFPAAHSNWIYKNHVNKLPVYFFYAADFEMNQVVDCSQHNIPKNSTKCEKYQIPTIILLILKYVHFRKNEQTGTAFS